MKPVKAVIIGAGARGYDAYAPHAIPGTMEVIAVADPDPFRRKLCAERFSIPEEHCYESYEPLYAAEKDAELAIICTNDRMHVEPARMAVEYGLHVMLEKPISPEPEEVLEIAELAEKTDKVFSICHVMRYTPFYDKLKGLLDSGRIGKLMHVVHTENVAFWHFANSYVRGKWRDSRETSPMILAKCCHDMDFLVDIIGGKCTDISSFGELSHFTAENAPEGAPTHCMDGCPIYDTCPYNAAKVYLNTPVRHWNLQNQFNLPEDTDEALLEALKTNQWGRCVYRCDNNVVDHQSVAMVFDNGVTVSFTASAFSVFNTRFITLLGTHGEIYGEIGHTGRADTITVRDFASGDVEVIEIGNTDSLGHSGGDARMMNSVIRAIRGGKTDRSSAQVSVQSHLMCFAVEKSRLEKRTIHMDDFIAEIRAKMK